MKSASVGLALLFALSLPVAGIAQPAPAAASSVPGLELPADMQVAPHRLVTIEAKTTGQVRFLVAGSVPVDYAIVGNTVLLVAPEAGQEVQIYAVALLVGEQNQPQTLSEFARTTIRVGQPAPRPGQPTAGRVHVTIIGGPQHANLQAELLKINCITRSYQFADVQWRTKPDGRPTGLEPLVSALGGQPALVIQDDNGKVMPDGKALPMPATEAAIIATVKQITGR